jgi:hypothetical protein
MNIENFEDLKEALYRKGFGTELNSQLENQIKSGSPEFMLERMLNIDKDEVGYRLHFRRDDNEEKDKVYFNRYDVAILKNADTPGEIREHSFPTEKLITAMEAYRMLKHGDLVAVNKTLFNKEGEQYNTWLSLDIKGAKDEYNNYPVNSYHQNYFIKKLGKSFDLKTELGNLPVPVKELEHNQYAQNIEKALKKANLVNVTIMNNGQESPGLLGVSPIAGTVIVYDANLKPIQRQEQQQTLPAPANKTATPETKQEDVKKKSFGDQKVTWGQKSQPNKGRSI